MGNSVENLTDIDTLKPWLESLSDKATLDGSIVMHDISDLDETSPIMMDAKNKLDFEMATDAIVKLRDQVVKKWAPGAQKYAMAVNELDLLPKDKVSESVKAAVKGLETLERQKNNQAINHFQLAIRKNKLTTFSCEGLFK